MKSCREDHAHQGQRLSLSPSEHNDGGQVARLPRKQATHLHISVKKTERAHCAFCQTPPRRLIPVVVTLRNRVGQRQRMIGMAVATTREIPPWIIVMILRVCCLVSAREKRTAKLLAVARTTPRGIRLLHSVSIEKPIALSHAYTVPQSPARHSALL